MKTAAHVGGPIPPGVRAAGRSCYTIRVVLHYDPMKNERDMATLAGGCFWCLEAVYNLMKGVESVESGYMGGPTPNPSYEAVCTGRTGHAEVVQVTFDPMAVSFQELLDVFFVIHDPTQLNRQGHDVGSQYRSAIFYHSPEQQAVAKGVIASFTQEQIFDRPIVTQVVPAEPFYVAEDYHQDYFARNPTQGYCLAVVAPKVAKFRARFAEKIKPSSLIPRWRSRPS